MRSDEEILYTLSECIKESRPISLIRIGDGELGVLNGFNDPENYERLQQRQTGGSLLFSDAIKVRDNLITAINDADILGLPFGKEKYSGYWASWKEMLDDFCPNWNTKELTSIDVHNNFLNKGYFETLLTGLPKLNYIGCRNLDAQFKEHFGIKKVWSYIVAPEKMFTSGYEGSPHYPTQFNNIKRWMDRSDFTGQICLVGAGFIGKIYCNWFRDKGGICVDVGNVMDLWAGKKTRGADRGLDVEYDKYKL